jgi:fatty-acyl-CoA synthase
MPVKGDKAVWEAQSAGHELLQTTIGELLDRQVAANPDHEALCYDYPELGIQMRLTYRQFADQIDRAAKGLLAMGVQRGEHVAIWAPNLPQWIFLDLALAKIGAVCVTINVTYRKSEVEYVLRQGDVTTLFMVEEVRGNSYVDALHAIAPELKELQDPARETLNSPALPKLKRVVLIGRNRQPGMMLYPDVLALGETVSDEEVKDRQAQVQPEDVAVMLYTSGTTGFPKGAQLTHSNLINDFHVLCSMARMEKNIRYVTSMPFFHIAGYSAHIFCLLMNGTLFPLLAFDPGKQLDMFHKERATLTFAVPTMLVAMLNHPKMQTGELDFSSFNFIWTGAAPVPVVLMEQIKERMGADCGIIFGLTETSGATTFTPVDDPFELKSSTVGLPLDHIALKVVNSDNGEPVSFGEPGELLVKGFNVMKGYYNMPEKTADAIDADGWFHTGDLATMNPQGYINIVGRVKDMIIRGGLNLYPAEIEAYIMRHPKIAEAQVVGVPDSFMGEEACALVRLKPGETATDDEIKEFIKASISHQKVPRYFRIVQEFPMTASGKVKKFELREALIKELGLEAQAAVKTA